MTKDTSQQPADTSPTIVDNVDLVITNVKANKSNVADEGAWIDKLIYGVMLEQQAITIGHTSILGIDPDTMSGKEKRVRSEDAIAEISRRMAITESDLAWCLGKLRGLGYPAEQLEAKYGFTAQSQEEA
ncbi:hypothetical protein UFOVP253_7 [uncultured Caudovirales phage]|uniref:Uncharacterized protein n=1 Tax=uncultured Caudovirales phage TaxID=2100421 RepID=A0A6J5LHF6_9CAUD|nr:hypothetical protein UFOVP253_7 [uncultured Caudovirales phage]